MAPAWLPGWPPEAGAGAVLRGLFEAFPGAMLVIDRDDRIVLASERAAALFGCRLAQLLGRTASAMLPDLGRAAVDEVTAVRADGSEVLLEVQRGSLETALGTLAMVSLRPLPDPIRTPDGLDDGDRRLRGEFVANMSHVLRTPLNSIIGFAKLMHHGKVGPVSARHREYLGDILNSAQHLLTLINDVLDLSKIDAGVMEFRPQPIDVPQLIGEVREVVAAMAATKQVQIEVSVDPSCTGFLLDPAKLKQVVYNLLSHALKFTQRGQIEVRARTEDAAHWRIEVEDSSDGLAPEEVLQLFAGPDGKHLGLTLSQRIVEAQGGRIGVRSTQGRGTTSFAVFPKITPLPAQALDPKAGS
jgi:PAS domain S-box-containing protein